MRRRAVGARKVFAAFERQLPRDWTVFHSRPVVLPGRGSGPAVERELLRSLIQRPWADGGAAHGGFDNRILLKAGVGE